MDRRNPYDLWLHIWDREFNFPKLQSICNFIWLCRDWILPGMEQKFIKTKLNMQITKFLKEKFLVNFVIK